MPEGVAWIAPAAIELGALMTGRAGEFYKGKVTANTKMAGRATVNRHPDY
jgi:hypothetical protein